MARTMNLNQTAMYRALIQRRETVDHEWVDYCAYGPYDSKSGCRDHGSNWRREEVAAGLRRRVTQVQAVRIEGVWNARAGREVPTHSIEWVDCD